MHPNLYSISFSIPTSINKGGGGGGESELEAILFWLFNSPYIKDVLEAFALGISFL